MAAKNTCLSTCVADARLLVVGRETKGFRQRVLGSSSYSETHPYDLVHKTSRQNMRSLEPESVYGLCGSIRFHSMILGFERQFKS